jgi:hypothetical protein
LHLAWLDCNTFAWAGVGERPLAVFDLNAAAACRKMVA